MSQGGPGAPEPMGPDLMQEHRSLMQFIHLAPVGLVQARHSGLVTLMNPKAAQLLAPLDFGDGEGDINLLDILDKASTDIRLMVQTFRRSAGMLCDNFRIMLPEQPIGGPDDAPIALGITILQLQADPDRMMVVITDESSAVKLQRMQASWIR